VVPGNLGDPSFSTDISGSGTGITNPRSPRLRVGGRWEQMTGATVVSPSQGNEARRKGRTGVGASHSIVEAGAQALLDPVEKRGCRVVGSMVGNTLRAWYLTNVSTEAHRIQQRDELRHDEPDALIGHVWICGSPGGAIPQGDPAT
jgi:hypothetical protein